LKHNSVLSDPGDTTCKYLHRKDLPAFAVEEGVREHAAEFAFFPALVRLSTKKPRSVVRYSEKFLWDKKRFDPLLHALAQYHKVTPHWVIVQSFTGGLDGLRALAHASLVRHYLATCDTWRSSYRLILGLLQEVDLDPSFGDQQIVFSAGESKEEATQDAVWDVVFARISGLQEYGWHAGIEGLTWITDSLNGSLSELDWPGLRKQLRSGKAKWTDTIIQHAKDEKAYFALKSDFGEPEEGEPAGGA
jgi:hypothetical protein